MTRNELHSQDISMSHEKGLDSKMTTALSGDDVTAKLQREADLLRDGLSSGFTARLEQAKDNLAATTLEVAGSFAIGSGLAWMAKAGGRWGTAAKVAGGAFTVMMAADVTRRAVPTWEAMRDTWNSDINLSQNKQIVGHYAGSALFDYPVMLGSGLAGAGAVHFAPKVTEMFKLRESTFPTSDVQMSLGDLGLLGAKEKRGTTAVDPLLEIRDVLQKPNSKAMGFGDLATVLEAKRLAVHPEVAPIRGDMIDTLAQIDALKPEIATNRSTLAAAEKQLGENLSLKTESKAVELAQRHLEGLQAENSRIGQLRAEEARLVAELRGKREPGAEVREPEVIRQELQDLRQDIRGAQRRTEGIAAAETALAEAQSALQARQKAIEAGTDPHVNDLQGRIQSLRDTVQTQEGRTAALTARLGDLHHQFRSTTDRVRPTLDQDSMPGSVPDLVKPRVEVAKPASAKVEPARAAAGDSVAQAKPVVAETPALKDVPQPKPVDVAPRPSERTPLQVESRPLPKPAVERPVERPVEKPVARPADRATERPQPQPERAVERDRPQGERKPEWQGGERRVTERDVAQALQDARRAVSDFARTQQRHTTALKCVTEYINRSFEWFGNEPAATGKANEILANVNEMLGQVKNWERGASWIPKHGPERATLMARNGMTAEQMAKFDAWADTVRQPYQPKPNQMAEMTLTDIQTHLQNRVQIESVKWYLKQAPDTAAATSAVVQKGFDMVRKGELPDGTPIHPDADLIVFEKKVRNVDGTPTEVIVPFAKGDRHMQRFDARHIINGMRKQELMAGEGPSALTAEELFGFRLDHDPSRLTGARNQVGFAILRPGGHFGKNIAYMEFSPNVDAALIPKQLRADVPGGPPGTNTGSLYNMLTSAGSGRGAAARPTPVEAPRTVRPEESGLPNLEIK